MTSDTAQAPAKSLARIQLDIALGKQRVNLGALAPAEFDALLKETLWDIDLGELRGFKPLRELLIRRPGSSGGSSSDPLSTVDISPDVKIEKTPEDHTVSLDSHCLNMSSQPGQLGCEITWKRHESGEETTDYKIADSWGDKNCYVVRAKQSLLILRRTPNRGYAEENLFLIRYHYNKVPHENRMAINLVEIIHIPIDSFRECFAKKYPSVAALLINSLQFAAHRTLDELKGKVAIFQNTAARIERLCDIVTY